MPIFVSQRSERSHRPMRTVFVAMLFACAVLILTPLRANAAAPAEPRGTLLVIGGALEKDNRAVYERFIELASAAIPPASPSPNPLRIVIATAASGEPEKSGESAKATIASYAPAGAEITIVHAATDAGATVAAFNGATGIFFTGGDQSRITARYRPSSPRPSPSADPSGKTEEGVEIAEMAALRGVLARGGVIAGTSAGAAMMGEEMFIGGSSAEALGVAETKGRKGKDVDPEEAVDAADAEKKQHDASPPGPRLAPGMGLVKGILTDSHFFERDRVGRLVVAIKVIASREVENGVGEEKVGAGGMRGMAAYGLGVAENACVEIDLTKRELRGVSEAPSLLVDARRSGFGVWARHAAGVRSENAKSPIALPVRACVGRLIRRGEVIRLAAQEAGEDAEFRQNEPPFSAARPEGAVMMLPRGEKERKSRRGSSGALFAMALRERDTVWRLELDGWGIEARASILNDTPDDPFSWMIFDLVKVEDDAVKVSSDDAAKGEHAKE